MVTVMAWMSLMYLRRKLLKRRHLRIERTKKEYSLETKRNEAV